MPPILTPLDLPPLPLLHVRSPDFRPVPPPPLQLIEPGDEGMPFLPPIGAPIASPRSRITDVQTPGHSSPHSQGFAPPIVDQTRNVTAASASVINSNGQFQVKEMNPGQQGVTVTASHAPLLTSNGEFQPRTSYIHDPATAVIGGTGLAVEVNADSQNHAHLMRPTQQRLPTAVTVHADRNNPARELPRTVTIR